MVTLVSGNFGKDVLSSSPYDYGFRAKPKFAQRWSDIPHSNSPIDPPDLAIQLALAEAPKVDLRIFYALVGNYPEAASSNKVSLLKRNIDISDDIHCYMLDENLHTDEQELFFDIDPIEAISAELFGHSEYLYEDKAFQEFAKQEHISMGMFFDFLMKEIKKA